MCVQRPVFFLIAALAALAGLAATAPAGADTVTLPASQDSTVYENFSDSGNGAGEWFFVVMTNTGMIRRGLIQFDLSGFAPGTVIQSVSLKLTLSVFLGSAPPIGLHRITESWTSEGGTNSKGPEGAPDLASPGDVTWEFRSFPNMPWTTLGGNFVATPSASQTVAASAGTYIWNSTPALVADVQGWVDQPATNFGWLLKLSSETGTRHARRFNSRSNSEGQPQLVITFVQAPFFADGFESGDTGGWSLTEQ